MFTLTRLYTINQNETDISWNRVWGTQYIDLLT